MNDTNNQQERFSDLSWLAGIWEGEGTISLVKGSKSRITPRASVVNSDYEMIDEISRILTEHNIGHFIQKRLGGSSKNPKHKDMKHITIAGVKRVFNFTNLMIPFIRSRKKQVAMVVRDYTKYRLSFPDINHARYSSLDLDFVKEVRALNQKGTSEGLKISSETTRQPVVQTEDIVQAVQTA